MAERMGTRCAVCVGCGRCFQGDSAASEGEPWSGERCEVCIGCGRCLEAWGLGPGTDAESGPTDWAAAFKAMDTGRGAPPPPMPGAPGSAPRKGFIEADGTAVTEAGAVAGAEADAVTGATPGVATACKELGLDDMAALNAALGIKPPGVS